MRHLLALALLAAAALADDVPLANPSFEAGAEAPAGWRQLAGPALAWPDDGGHEGARYVRLTDPDAKTGVSVESAHLPVRVGGVYRLAGWVRTADRCRPGLYLQFHDEVGARIAETHAQATGPTDGWQRVEVTATAPEGAAEVSALLYAYIGDVGTADFDDLTLTVEGGRPGWFGVEPARPGGFGEKPVVDIGSRLELFVDGWLVDGLSGDARRVLHHPVPREVVLSFDAPWEGATSAYVSVVQDEGKVRLYYRGSGHAGAPSEVTCYAESSDGIHFTKPELGLVEFAGSTANNIVWAGPGTHNFAVFRDTNPDAPADQRYKALGGGPLFAFASADGLHWRKLAEEPVITEGAFDSQNLAFWDAERGCYVAIVRDFKDGVRTIRTCTSPDFIHWSTPEWADYGAAPPEQLYTNATVPYFRAPHLYLAFPKRFVPGRTALAGAAEPGVSDGVLMSSRDGVRWERWREGFLRPGPDPDNWTDRNNMIAWGLVPASPTEIALYWSEHYRHDTARLRRGTVRTDGFASIAAGAEGGELLTRQITFAGRELVVNYATSAAGALRFALCDEAGEPLPGFSLADSEILFGDEIEHAVRWGQTTDVSTLAGRTVRLRVYLKDADLYSVRFR